MTICGKMSVMPNLLANMNLIVTLWWWPVEASQSCNSVWSTIQLTVMTQDYNLCVSVREVLSPHHVSVTWLITLHYTTPHLSQNALFYGELTQVFIGLCNKSTPEPRCTHKIILFGQCERASVSLASEQPSLNLSLSLSTENMCVWVCVSAVMCFCVPESPAALFRADTPERRRDSQVG